MEISLHQTCKVLNTVSKHWEKGNLQRYPSGALKESFRFAKMSVFVYDRLIWTQSFTKSNFQAHPSVPQLTLIRWTRGSARTIGRRFKQLHECRNMSRQTGPWQGQFPHQEGHSHSLAPGGASGVRWVWCFYWGFFFWFGVFSPQFESNQWCFTNSQKPLQEHAARVCWAKQNPKKDTAVQVSGCRECLSLQHRAVCGGRMWMSCSV